MICKYSILPLLFANLWGILDRKTLRKRYSKINIIENSK